MNNTININSGLESVNLVFEDRNEVVTISFNPSDMDIILRINKSQENIKKELDKIPSELKLNSDMSEEEEFSEYAVFIQKVNDLIYKEVDSIFGNSVSKEVFKFCNPLSADKSGLTFIERFLNAVAPYIKERIEKTKKATEKRVDKHIGKYKK